MGAFTLSQVVTSSAQRCNSVSLLIEILRRTVSIEEQAVPKTDEVDRENDYCSHVIAKLDGKPIGTDRLQAKEGSVKIRRVCISCDYRKNYGADLICFIVGQVAQTYAQHFMKSPALLHIGPNTWIRAFPHWIQEACWIRSKALQNFCDGAVYC